jgi:hypothetical protein
MVVDVVCKVQFLYTVPGTGVLCARTGGYEDRKTYIYPDQPPFIHNQTFDVHCHWHLASSPTTTVESTWRCLCP